MIGVPQLFEDRWQQDGSTPPAAPVKRGRGRPRKHPLPQDKGGGIQRRPSKSNRRVHTDDEWSDWNESSYDTWQPEWGPQQPGGPGEPAGMPGVYPGYPPPSGMVMNSPGTASPSVADTPITGPSSAASPGSVPPSSMITDLTPPPTSQMPPVCVDDSADWRDDYCYSMTYDMNYILSTTSPENTQVIPRLPPTTDQSGNCLAHWHANPPIPSATAHQLYSLTGYEGTDEPPPVPTTGE